MSETITYSLTVQVVGGPKVSASGTLTPEAYDKIGLTVAKGDSDKEVNLQPDGADLAELLFIKASSYETPLTYTVNAKNAATPKHKLDGPHVLIGAGAVSLLDAAPTKLFFTNGGDADVTVDILVGRDATP